MSMRGSRGGGRGPDSLITKYIGFPSNTGSGPLKIQCWANDGPPIVVIGSFLPGHQLKKNVVKGGPPLTKFSRFTLKNLV